VRIAAADDSQWAFAATDESGVYRAQLESQSAAIPSAEVFAVNVDTAESDLSKAELDELPREFTVKTEWQNLDDRPTPQIGRRNELHRSLLYAALALVLFEPCLAWLFGRGRV
jgi:hypothetical protein